jgi:hypothetical protein
MSESLTPVGDYFILNTHISQRNAVVLDDARYYMPGLDFADHASRSIAKYAEVGRSVKGLIIVYDDREEAVVPVRGFTPTVQEEMSVRLQLPISAATATCVAHGQVKHGLNTEQYMDDALRVYGAWIAAVAVNASTHMVFLTSNGPMTAQTWI